MIFLKYSSKVTPYSFNYYDTESWADSYPMCGGPMQSPVELTANRLAFSRTPELRLAKDLKNGEMKSRIRDVRSNLGCGLATGLGLFCSSSPTVNRCMAFIYLRKCIFTGANNMGSEHSQPAIQ